MKRHHIPIFSPSADMSTIDFAAVSCDRRTNDSNLIKSALTQKHAAKSLDAVFHLRWDASGFILFFHKLIVLGDIGVDVEGKTFHIIF